jgi:hypothetical protein
MEGSLVHPIKPSAKCRQSYFCEIRLNEWSKRMKTYRLITLVVAALITVSLARVFTHETATSFTVAGAL